MNGKKYIDPALIDFTKEVGNIYTDCNDTFVSLKAVRIVLARAKVDDVEPVVHCSKCKSCHRRSDQFGNIEYYCQQFGDYVSGGDFCSRGTKDPFFEVKEDKR